MKNIDNDVSGIYRLLNTENEAFYIGSSKNCLKRSIQHYTALKANTHCNRKLQNAWNKYGDKSFIFEILEECSTDFLIIREQWYIDNLNPKYNLRKIADSCLGVKHSSKTKLRQSEAKIKNSIENRGAIYQYDIKGNFIKKWLTIIHISRALNVSHNKISLSVGGYTFNCMGFIFSRKSPKEFDIQTHKRKIKNKNKLNYNLLKENIFYKKSLNDELLCTYNNIQEVCNDLGITPRTVYRISMKDTIYKNKFIIKRGW